MSTNSSNISFKQLAKSLSLVENNAEDGKQYLQSLSFNPKTKIIGITGPPGAGKSTLVNALLEHWVSRNLKVGVLSVDPSSPFNFGALLGDRVRMSSFYTHPNVFIRSISSRGSLGGLSTRIIEMTDVMRSADFDYILLETVGVGQSEVEVAGIADSTVVVLVPEAGDEVQTMKAGLMEIADIFVVNKSDRIGAETFVKHLKTLVHDAKSSWEVPVIKCIANESKGIAELVQAIDLHQKEENGSDHRRKALILQKAWQLLQEKYMNKIDKAAFKADFEKASSASDFNLYQWIGQWN